MDALTFEYRVKFPLSLIISRKCILQYQLVFRFLLHLRHVEQSLSSMWIDHKLPMWRKPAPQHKEFDQWRNRAFLLRARMLSFVQQILAFATFEVLEPHWRRMEAKLANVDTVDQLLRDHVDFLDTCLKECMLTSSKLLKVRHLYCPFLDSLAQTSSPPLHPFSHGPPDLFPAHRHLFHICPVRQSIQQIRHASHGRPRPTRQRCIECPDATTVGISPQV